ncbi:GvpL/GvpF family gas vesicle protein [Nonomuraea wenchangensis]|uniref:GvpL/GvpF family gas vesicle protein n=1 Tax=Nonomuraea wenchangensis TaxID=568860 RepID=UPI00341C8654
MSDTGTYLYAVARDEVAVCPPGVADADVRTIVRGGLVAYVSSVPMERFGEEPLRRSLEDMDWLAGTARAHHRVVNAVAAATATAPVRLVTVYEGDEQVSDLLERRAGDFAEVLAQVTGRREWGVKAFVDPASEERPDERSGRDGCEQAGKPGKPGTAYLQRRRANLRGREQNRRQALARAEHIHAALATVAVASRRHRPQDPRLSGRADWMLLNGAYLVDEGRVAEFAGLAEELGGGGIEVTVTGPWAPYSFTVMETR